MEREQTTTTISDILSEGTGTPYVAIFDAGSSAILDPSTNMPIGELVDNFVYEYTEEKEDSGSFVIVSNGPSICDLPQLQHSEILWLQWGYILPNHTVICGEPRQVMITDISVSFRNNGVSMEVKFADSSIKLKNIPANYFSKEANFFQDLSSILNGYSITPVIKRYPKSTNDIGYYLLEKQPKPDYETSVHQEPGTATVIEPTGYVTYDALTGKAPSESFQTLKHQSSIQPATELPPDAVPIKVTILDRDTAFSEEIQSLIQEYPDKYKLINPNALNTDYRALPTEENLLLGETYRSILVTNSAPNNMWGQLNSLARQLPGGPFYMDGRDGSLVIHNGMHTRPVSLKYTYLGGKGELLDFQINSKFIRSAVEVVSGADIDPDSKDLVSTVVQGIPDRTLVNPDIYYAGWESTPEATDSSKSSSNSQGGYDQYHNVSGTNNWTNLQYGTGDLYTDGYRKGSLRMVPKTYASDPTVYLEKGQITEEEKEQWLRETFQEWDRTVNSGSISTQQELQDYIHNGFYLKPLKVKRVKIIDIVAYDKGASASTYNTDGLDIGYYYENTIDKRISKLLGDTVEILSTTRIGYPRGQINTNEFPTYGYSGQRYYDTPSNSAAVYRVVYQEEESIDGVRVLNDITDFTSILQTNDVQENLSNQIQATATVLGRPSLESSMNVEVNNVAKFSGIWYTKKVIHRINTSNGYTSEIEFVQRSSNVVETIISKRQALSDISQQLNKDVAKSIEAGTWQRTQPEFIQEVISGLEKSPTFWIDQSSLLVSPNPGGYTVVSSDKDVTFNTAEGLDHQNQIAKNQ